MTKHEEFQEAEFEEVGEELGGGLLEDSDSPESTPTEEPAEEPSKPLEVRIVLHGGMPSMDGVFHEFTDAQFPEFIAYQMENSRHGGFFMGKVFFQDSKVHYFEQLN